jgi:hypothetical protein
MVLLAPQVLMSSPSPGHDGCRNTAISDQQPSSEPSMMKWALGVAASAGMAGMLCCVAPMVLFMLGIMGGVYAISFADLFYAADGSAGTGAWVLRGVAVVVGLAGLWMYRRRQDQCSIDQGRRQKNLVLLGLLVAVLGVGFFFTLEQLSGWYFSEYIVPAKQAQQAELGISPAAGQ